MVHLEDGQPHGLVRIAAAEGVQPRPQHRQLPHAALHRVGQRVLGEAAADGDEETHQPPFGMSLGVGVTGEIVRVLTEDADRQRVPEG